MLSALRPAALARVRFPLGELTKPQVREIAAAAGLPVAEKRESQDLCFLAGTIARALPRAPRRAARPSRRGRGRARARARAPSAATAASPSGSAAASGVAAGEPLFVLSTDAAANRVVVGPREALAARTRARCAT